MVEKSASTVIQSAKLMLDIARAAETDFNEGGIRRLSGLYQAVTSGRSVTFVLQNMRGHVDGFDSWYEGVKKRLAEDPVCRWFVEVRNRIEKQGSAGIHSSSVHVVQLDTGELMRAAPEGTVAAFLGDQLGRNGWVVALPDGSEQTVYFTLPPSVGETALHIEDAPGGADITSLLAHYLATLDAIVSEAEQVFPLDHR